MELAGVYVGEPGVLGYRRERPVLSAITKARVTAPELALTELNLDGDRQADLKVHGGLDKGVYVYPAEHYPPWAGEGSYWRLAIRNPPAPSPRGRGLG